MKSQALRRAVVWSMVLAGLSSGLAGCSDDAEVADPPRTTSTVPPADSAAPDPTPMGADDLAALTGEVGDGGCEELDPTRCMLPFPSDDLTVSDPDTETGRRVELPTGQLVNQNGSPLDPTEWNRNDGFSPGSPMLVAAPGVDLDASGTAPIGDIGRSMERSSPTAVIDLDTGERIPHWVELDSNGTPGSQLLIVRPAISLPEAHRIGVVLSGLVDSGGNPLPSSLGFRALRDSLTTGLEPVEDRREAMDELFTAAGAVGIARSDVYVAWSFTVASSRNLSERLLAIRDDAFERIGEGAPAFTVDEVVTTDLPDGIGRRVRGTVMVPSYLTGTGEPGSRLTNADAGGLPIYGGYEYPAGFTCQIPAVALDGGDPETRPVVYGHGLLGSSDESQNSQVAKIASSNNMMYCATDWIGMSRADVGNAVAILNDLSLFPSLPDRSQQGILNQLVLARAMRSTEGFATHEAFGHEGSTVLDLTEVYYDGNSQGGIMGGAATAVSTEWTKAVLGVPGMNYALLLPRSVDFDQYFAVLRGAYPDPVDQQLIYGILSMLWDRAEANGYAQHMTDDPYPGTPEHQVILHVGFGDHQVAQVSAEIEARTIGAAVRGPALEDGRHPDEKPFYGLDVLEQFPTDRSVLVYWDSGSLAPPDGNITPTASEEYVAACGALDEDAVKRDRKCADSHEDPRRALPSILQKDLFFRPDGLVQDTCDGLPCVAEHRALLDY